MTAAHYVPESILDDWASWGICDWRPDAGQWVALQGGLTNRSWLMLLSSGQYVLRQHSEQTEALDIQRDQEYRVQQAASAAGLAPEVVYRHPDDTYWIIRFLPGEGLVASDNMPLKALAAALNRLHELPVSNVDTLTLSEKTARYWGSIEQRYSETKTQPLRDQIEALLDQRVVPVSTALCHMDPNPANWRNSNGRWLLLDWEYAAIGNPLWDFACFAQMAQLSGRVLEQWVRLAGSNVHSTEWRWAVMEVEYMAQLWYAIQGMIDLDQLEQSLLVLQTQASAISLPIAVGER